MRGFGRSGPPKPTPLRLDVTGARRKWIVGTGELDRLYPGVYRIAGVPWSWEAQLLTYCWAQQPHGYASHRSAARLWGVSGFNDRCTITDIEEAVDRLAGQGRAGTKKLR